jgi:hypothetical protein
MHFLWMPWDSLLDPVKEGRETRVSLTAPIIQPINRLQTQGQQAQADKTADGLYWIVLL